MSEPGAAHPYDKSYYASYCSRQGDPPYGRDPVWLAFFASIADTILSEFGPQTALDAGCAMGLLVEALRERGVEAEGVDISEYAIGEASAEVRPHLWVGSILEPLPRRYDLIICIETLEHLSRADAERAIANLCRHTDDLLFSSTPENFKEATHINVQAPERWAELFARQGFVHDLDTDLSLAVSRWARRFRRSSEPLHRVLADYERHNWRLADENTQLRELAIETRNQVATVEGEVEALRRELEKIKGSRAYRSAIRARTLLRRIVPRRPEG